MAADATGAPYLPHTQRLAISLFVGRVARFHGVSCEAACSRASQQLDNKTSLFATAVDGSSDRGDASVDGVALMPRGATQSI